MSAQQEARELTPTTGDVRKRWIGGDRHVDMRLRQDQESAAGFDRWLAVHDAAVESAAWRARGEADRAAVDKTPDRDWSNGYTVDDVAWSIRSDIDRAIAALDEP